jgi:[ribosomal protein S5]-alanine N-acetyltransferase
MRMIETERLVLVPLEERHLPSLHQMLFDPTVMQWLFSGKPMERSDREHFINNAFTFGGETAGLGALIEKSAQTFIGFAGLLPCEFIGENSYELGFALGQNHWRQGYATEIGNAQIKFAFDHFDIDRLFALAHPNNTGSYRALEKIGMEYLRTIETQTRGARLLYAIRRKNA